jgi:serine/threonine-protein kinase
MPLKPGTHLGPYEILSQIGAGGMGEVYKARDPRLNRIVAIKVLSAHLAERAELRERFKREAETIANLKHPNICVLYDIGEDNGTHYLVMEFLEGETLAQRLLNGPLPLDQVLKYATEISDALDKAHRHGATHRDIKPGNIMLTKEGSKLLDFGLAKLKQEAAQPNISLSQLPTGQGPLTQDGTILGTLQYMAPEQVEGKVDEIDARTDIFAFGAVVFEMATGKKCFEGQSAASTIAKILEHDPPPISSLQPMTPPALDRTVKRCLRKEPAKRWQTASDLHEELAWIAQGGSEAPKTTPLDAEPAWNVWRRVPVLGLAGVLIAALTALAVWTLKPTPLQPVSRVTITLPPGQRLASLDQPAIAISPDGKNLVYVAVQDQSRDSNGAVAPPANTPPLAGARGSDTSPQQLFLRPLDSMESKPIAGTDGAVGPFFSPDGQWIGFFGGGRLKKVSINGGAAMTLASGNNPGGASWSSQGTLAFQPLITGSLPEVSQEGGTQQPLTRLDKGEIIHRWPEYLPGGKTLLFAGSATSAAWNNPQIAVQPLGTGERKNLAQGTQPRYAATGHLLYAQFGTLMAAPFDAGRLALSGAAIPVVEGVMQSTLTGAAQYHVSSAGTLVYLAGGVVGSQSRLVWVSRNGEEQPVRAVPHNYQFPRVSPDGRRVSLVIAEQETQLWVYDLSRDTLTRLTFEGNANAGTAWSPETGRGSHSGQIALAHKICFGSSPTAAPVRSN